MDGKNNEDGYLLGISPRSTPPRPRSTLAQLAEGGGLGSLQYLLASSKSNRTMHGSSPPSRNRPRASTGIAVTAARGAGTSGRLGEGRSRRSTSGDIEETATAAVMPPSRGLFLSAPDISRERPRSQGSSHSSRRLSFGNGKSSSNSGNVYRLSIDNVDRAHAGSNNNGNNSGSSSASAGVRPQGQRMRPPPSRSNGITPERDAPGRAAPRQRRKESGGLSTAAAAAAASDFSGGGGGVCSRSSHSLGAGNGVGTSDSDGHDSFFGYDDGGHEGNDHDEDNDDADAYGRRRRLQNGCCLLLGVSWASALLLLCFGGSVSAGGAASASAAARSAPASEAAAGCALLGVLVLAVLVLFLGLPTWRREEEDDSRDACCCFFWGRRNGGVMDEGGRLDTVGGVTYLAI